MGGYNNPDQSMMTGGYISAAGAVTNAYSQYQQGQIAQSVSNSQARSLDNSASSVITSGYSQAKKFQTQTSRMEANQRASMAANGVDPNSGTNVDVQTDTAGQAELDRLTILYNANMKAWELNQEASQQRLSGKSAALAGKINAASTLLSGAGQFSDIWNKWKMTSQGKTNSNDYDSGIDNFYNPVTGQHGS
jgi:hypothetical protein